MENKKENNEFRREVEAILEKEGFGGYEVIYSSEPNTICLRKDGYESVEVTIYRDDFVYRNDNFYPLRTTKPWVVIGNDYKRVRYVNLRNALLAAKQKVDDAIRVQEWKRRKEEERKKEIEKIEQTCKEHGIEILSKNCGENKVVIGKKVCGDEYKEVSVKAEHYLGYGHVSKVVITGKMDLVKLQKLIKFVEELELEATY